MNDNVIDFNKAKAPLNTPEVEATELRNKKKKSLSKLPQFRGEVPSKNTIRGLPGLKVGEIFWVTMDEKAYVVADIKGHKYTLKPLDETATISTGMTIYDMNKNIVSKEPLFDWNNKEAVTELFNAVSCWFADGDDETYILYGRDIHYVSIIQLAVNRPTPVDPAVIFETLGNIGDLISVDFNTVPEKKNIEIWIRMADAPAEMLYLLPFDKGVITI